MPLQLSPKQVRFQAAAERNGFTVEVEEEIEVDGTERTSVRATKGHKVVFLTASNYGWRESNRRSHYAGSYYLGTGLYSRETIRNAFFALTY